MKNKPLKHEAYELPDGSLVIYLSAKTIFLEPFRDIFDSFAPRKIVAWIMAPKNWDAFVDIVLDGDDMIKQQGHWRYRDCPVYRGKLKTRIKQLEGEIKHKEQMKANAALDPMNVINIDKFDKHSAETEKVYITGGDLEKSRRILKIDSDGPIYVASDDEPSLDEETFNKIKPETVAIFNVDKGFVAGGNPRSLTPDELTKKVRHLMGDPSFKITYDSTENKKAFQRGFRLGILPSTVLVIIYIVKLLINLL